LINPLKEAGAFTEFPPEYVENVSKYREVVRNSFAHGDWFELAKEVQDLDLEKAFVGTAKLMEHLQSNLQRIRPNEYYEVIIGEQWPEEQAKPHPRLWKFLVEVPENAQSSHEQKAIFAAKKVGGAELRNDFSFSRASWAKLVPVDPVKLDFTKCDVGDECRVWVVRKSNGSETSPFL
jgi:hypothetical protein